jgi:dTDP-4-dehydrorhamnose reductase
MEKNIVLIGCNGQLGTDIALAGVDIDMPLFPVDYPEVDITDREKLHYKIKEANPGIIINTAATTDTGHCEEDPEKAFKVNTIGVKNLVDFCLKNDCTLIQISTDYIFDGGKIKTKEPYTEDDIPNPINIYGLSKYAG